jgi:transcriptional regulator with GAF, ATPase, and Fis domain
MLWRAFKTQEPAISSYPKQHFPKSLSILHLTAARGLTELGGNSLVATTVSWRRHGGVSPVIPQKRDLDAIIGTGRSLRHALSQVESVATTDSPVLILGETGTGKELIARAIHKLSPRRDRPFVSANCASIPAGLLESELFGHEKGAFTSAVARTIGRFELAHKGTIFLDEVGDIPLELQSKLLRVLQEREIERLGSTQTLRVDFRLIAATHRNLSEMVADSRFRSDLYYRLSVFPIQLPPLRDRPEDIHDLVWHFVARYSRRMNKRIETIRLEDMDALANYHWPGNVRELQNVIERCVILSSDTVLAHPILGQSRPPETSDSLAGRTLAEVQREHILQALQATDWVIGGPDGAAARLGLKRTTLLYKMRRLGLFRTET